jgi:UTP-glucose-1-phosphate uridylyltransferase
MLMTGESYDCGKKMGYMQAFVSYGLRNRSCYAGATPNTLMLSARQLSLELSAQFHASSFLMLSRNLVPSIAALAKKQSVDAMLMTGESYDCGKKMGYMQAFVTP